MYVENVRSTTNAHRDIKGRVLKKQRKQSRDTVATRSAQVMVRDDRERRYYHFMTDTAKEREGEREEEEERGRGSVLGIDKPDASP